MVKINYAESYWPLPYRLTSLFMYNWFMIAVALPSRQTYQMHLSTQFTATRICILIPDKFSVLMTTLEIYTVISTRSNHYDVR